MVLVSKENNDNNDIRQFTLVNLNSSVNLLSSYPEENMSFLIDKAVSLMNEIKKGDEK